MYDQVREDTLFVIFYTLVTGLAMTASCYLLFRRGNAFALDITTPSRLRRWAAVFFASIALNHLWYMPIFFLNSIEDIRLCDLIGGLLDFMTFFPLSIVVLLAMLQDRRRPLWPVAVVMAPFVVGGAFGVANHSYVLLPMLQFYAVLLGLGLIIYMVRATRQYGRWLRDNYADLEHKEVWQSFVVLAIIMFVFVIYGFAGEGPVLQYAMQVICVALICYLLWRVETLSDLSIPLDLAEAKAENGKASPTENDGEYQSPNVQTTHENIGPLLQQYCIDTQLYLQHDLTIIQLAKAIGTNRFYLSQYFSSQGITYNEYINNLRINHFVRLYREAVATQRSFTAQQLAGESGYRSYSTFGIAFKQRMGQTVTAWMRDTAK